MKTRPMVRMGRTAATGLRKIAPTSRMISSRVARKVIDSAELNASSASSWIAASPVSPATRAVPELVGRFLADFRDRLVHGFVCRLAPELDVDELDAAVFREAVGVRRHVGNAIDPRVVERGRELAHVLAVVGIELGVILARDDEEAVRTGGGGKRFLGQLLRRIDSFPAEELVWSVFDTSARVGQKGTITATAITHANTTFQGLAVTRRPSLLNTKSSP